MTPPADTFSLKARLIDAGEIFVPPSVGSRLPCRPSMSSTGPDAKQGSLVFEFNNDENGRDRVKLAISRDANCVLSLRMMPDSSVFAIYQNSSVLVQPVTIVPTLLHAPGQAFVSLHEECIYSCIFCTSAYQQPDPCRKQPSLDDIVNLIMQASEHPDFTSVAITSSVLESPSKTVDDMVYCIEQLHKRGLPQSVPIGVEPFLDNKADIDRLHSAGATELKLNLHAYDRALFGKICPQWDFDLTRSMIEYGSSVFGRNRVCSNMLVGLGESDGSIIAGIEYLARLGVVTTLRKIRINDYNRETLAPFVDADDSSPQRILALAKMQAEVFEKYGLKTDEFRTMCHKCGCCDISPV